MHLASMEEKRDPSIPVKHTGRKHRAARRKIRASPVGIMAQGLFWGLEKGISLEARRKLGNETTWR